jgi:hypothetical protein
MCLSFFDSERVGDGGEKVGSGRGRGNGSVCVRETK